jgi:DNA replicative helicase MCM subunit Mcm2 (Cdc46/Mcm family)
MPPAGRMTPYADNLSHPYSHSAFFRCLVCQHTVQEEIDRGRINEPDKCPRDECQSAGTMTLIHNRSDFADKQVIRLQETPGTLSAFGSNFVPTAELISVR